MTIEELFFNKSVTLFLLNDDEANTILAKVKNEMEIDDAVWKDRADNYPAQFLSAVWSCIVKEI